MRLRARRSGGAWHRKRCCSSERLGGHPGKKRSLGEFQGDHHSEAALRSPEKRRSQVGYHLRGLTRRARRTIAARSTPDVEPNGGYAEALKFGNRRERHSAQHESSGHRNAHIRYKAALPLRKRTHDRRPELVHLLRLHGRRRDARRRAAGAGHLVDQAPSRSKARDRERRADRQADPLARRLDA